MGIRNFLAQAFSGRARNDRFDIPDEVMVPDPSRARGDRFNLPDEFMFPDPGQAMERSFLDVSSLTGSMVDMSTPAGAGLGMMDIDPLAKSFCAGLDGANRRDEDQ